MPFWEEDDREKFDDDSGEEPLADLSRHQHSLPTQHVFHVLRDFVGEFSKRSEVANLISVMEGEKVLASNESPKSVVLDQKPERFIEDYLVSPLLESLGHEIRFRPNNFPVWTPSVPDFRLEDFDVEGTDEGPYIREGCDVIGEVKPPNDIEDAKDEAQEYLDEDAGVHAISIATDGLRWKAWIQMRTEGQEKLLDIELTEPVVHLCREYKEEYEVDNNYVRDSIESQEVASLSREGLEQEVRKKIVA